jgi:hypothetical protein
MIRKPNLSVISNSTHAFSGASTSIAVKGNVYAKTLNPNGIPTVSIKLTVEDAQHLALLLNLVCNVPNKRDHIEITGHAHNKEVTVLRFH